MEIRPRLCNFSRSSLVQITVFWLSVPARGLLAARREMARVVRVIEIASENGREPFVSPPFVFLRLGVTDILDHFVHAFVEVLCVLVRVIGERVTRSTSPDQFLCFC